MMKLTEREMYTIIAEVANGERTYTENEKASILELCSKKIAQMDKKNARAKERAEKKNAEKSAKDQEIAESLMDGMRNNNFFSLSASELRDLYNEGLNESDQITTNKVASVIQRYCEGKVTKKSTSKGYLYSIVA